MGLFDVFKGKGDKVKDAATGGGGMVAGSNAENAVGSLLGGGGLASLINKFQASGLGGKMNSWIGKGDNLPMTEDEVKSVVGPDQVSAVASELGVSSDEATKKIAGLLPTIIDRLTPDGVVPDPQGLADKLTGFLKR